MEVNAYSLPGLKVSDKVIIDSVCKVYGISSKDLFKPTRKRNIVEPRQIAIYLILVIGQKGPTYAEKVYNIDHSTAIYSLNTVKALYQASKQYQINFKTILDEMKITYSDRANVIKFLHEKIDWKSIRNIK